MKHEARFKGRLSMNDSLQSVVTMNWAEVTGLIKCPELAM